MTLHQVHLNHRFRINKSAFMREALGWNFSVQILSGEMVVKRAEGAGQKHKINVFVRTCGCKAKGFFGPAAAQGDIQPQTRQL